MHKDMHHQWKVLTVVNSHLHSSAHILSLHVHCIHMYMYMYLTTQVRETPERQIPSQLLSKEQRSCLSWNVNPQHIFYMYMCALPTEQLRQLSHMNMQCTCTNVYDVHVHVHVHVHVQCMLYSLKLWSFWTQSPYFWHSANRHFLSFFTSPAHSNNNTHRYANSRHQRLSRCTGVPYMYMYIHVHVHVHTVQTVFQGCSLTFHSTPTLSVFCHAPSSQVA